MKTTYLSASELKRNTAEVLNAVAYGGSVAIVERYGEPLVKIIPAGSLKREKKASLRERLEKTFGSMPDFPDVTKYRYFRKRKI